MYDPPKGYKTVKADDLLDLPDGSSCYVRLFINSHPEAELIHEGVEEMYRDHNLIGLKNRDWAEYMLPGDLWGTCTTQPFLVNEEYVMQVFIQEE